ncbi:MAG: hypothetical protein AMXMBFR84_01140 [Candidatus Hydrogenedentota bacterium]
MKNDLITTRLRMTPASAADAYDLWVLWIDPDVRRYLWDDRILPLEEAEQVVARFENELGLWVIRPHDYGHTIGFAGLRKADWCDEVEPLIGFYPFYWGEGYGEESLRALMDYAVRTLKQTTLVAGVDALNQASRTLVERVGFVQTAEFPGDTASVLRYRWQG